MLYHGKAKKCCYLFPILWGIVYRLCSYAKMVLWYSWSVVPDFSRICTTRIMGTSMSSKPQQHGLCVCIALFSQNALLSYEMQTKLKKLMSYLKISIAWKSCYVILLQHKYLLYADKRRTENKDANTSSGHVYHIKSTTVIIAWFESHAPNSSQSYWFLVNKGHTNIGSRVKWRIIGTVFCNFTVLWLIIALQREIMMLRRGWELHAINANYYYQRMFQANSEMRSDPNELSFMSGYIQEEPEVLSQLLCSLPATSALCCSLHSYI